MPGSVNTAWRGGAAVHSRNADLVENKEDILAIYSISAVERFRLQFRQKLIL